MGEEIGIVNASKKFAFSLQIFSRFCKSFSDQNDCSTKTAKIYAGH